MNQKEFEQQVFNNVMEILNKKSNLLIVDKRGGYYVFDDKKIKLFGITVRDLYAVINVRGTDHSLPFDMAAKIYNKCCDLYIAQKDLTVIKTVIKEVKKLTQNAEQNTALNYLKQIVAYRQK